MKNEFWKFKLPEPGQTVRYLIPIGWVKTLVEGGYMWVRVDLNNRDKEVEITTVATGQPFDAELFSLGTWRDPPFVWHAVARVLG